MADNGQGKIDKGIPIPTSAAKYPWKTLEVGESFLMPLSLTPGGAYSQAGQKGRLIGKKFTVRKTAEGYRVWRTA